MRSRRGNEHDEEAEAAVVATVETRKTADEASSSSMTIDVGEEITVKSNEKEKVSSLGTRS
jgi:hypothetical protein